jgi:hypothetical protein
MTESQQAYQAEANVGRGTGVTAKTLATLAVAHEQRTANLIAYLVAASKSDVALPYRPSESVLKAVQAEVEERLGLV